MKIAVCISGQLREWESPHPSIIELIDKLKADIFINTWSTAGRTSAYDRLFGSSYLASLFVERDKKGIWKYDQKIWKRLPSVYELFYGRRNIDAYAVIEKYKPIAIDLEEEPVWRESRTLHGVHYPKALEEVVSLRHINSMPMFYKIWAADNMARLHSEYDVFFRLRLDTYLSDVDSIISQLQKLEDNTIYLPRTDRSDFANDMFAFGSSQAMLKYSSVWKKLPDYWNLDNYLNFPLEKRTAEQLLDFHIKQENLDRVLLPTRCYLDERVNPVPEDLTLRAIEADLSSQIALTPNEERAVSFLRERAAAKILASLSKDELTRFVSDKSNCQRLGVHNLPPLNHACGKASENLGLLDKAEHHFRKAHDYYGDFWPDPSNDFSRVLKKNGKLSESIGVLSKVVSIFPKNFYSWRDLSFSYEMIWRETGNSNFKNMAVSTMNIAINSSKGDFSINLRKRLERIIQE